MTLEICKKKENIVETKNNFTLEQMKILEQENAERQVNEKLHEIEFEKLIENYRRNYLVSRQDAIQMIDRDFLNY